MLFLQNISQIYLVGDDANLNNIVKDAVKNFVDSWELDIEIEVKTDYLDLIIENTRDSVLFVTTEPGLEKLEKPNVFSVLKERSINSKILHLYRNSVPSNYDLKEQKSIDNFVDLSGDYSLQFNRALRQINN